MNDRALSRRDVLKRCGADGNVLDELLAYNENRFDTSLFDDLRFPLTDEPHVEAWRRYAAEAETGGFVPAVGRRLAQLRFQIAKGISQSDEYLAATRRGVVSDSAPFLRLARAEEVRLRIHQTLAGALPVIVAAEREDFENLVRAFSCRNEPDEVPASMGACIVTGLNNWDRVRAHRTRWEAEHPDAGEAEWKEEFSRLAGRKELYQDRFLILSSGPYSAVPAEATGFAPEEWRRLSVEIRLEHECTHYFTYRVLGSMRNNLLDEIIADYAGLVKALGAYRRDLALLFFGLESYPQYRTGGRLENYLGKPPLSAEAFAILRSLVQAAISNIAEAEERQPLRKGDDAELARRVVALASSPLEMLASSGEAVAQILLRGAASATAQVEFEIHDDEGLQLALDDFRAFAGGRGIPSKPVSDLSIVLDELLSNVIKYGFREKSGTIRMSIVLAGDELTVTILDDAPQFNVLEAPKPQTQLAASERPIGGLGILIVRQLCDGIHYEWVEERNRLVIRKRVR